MPSLVLLPVALAATVTMEYAYCYGRCYRDPSHPAPGTLSLFPQAPPKCCDTVRAA